MDKENYIRYFFDKKSSIPINEHVKQKTGNCQTIIYEFLDRITREWITGMSEQSKENIIEVFYELNDNVTMFEFTKIMKEKNLTNPFSLLGLLFEQINDVEVIELKNEEEKPTENLREGNVDLL